MTKTNLPLSHRTWQHGLGLLPVPLYRDEKSTTRHVLLNGVEGNFCLDESISLSVDERSAIAWSANVGHHVFVAENFIEVVRWDRPDLVEKYTASSVQQNLERFHKFLEQNTPNVSHSVISHALGVYRGIRSSLREGQAGSDALSAFLYLLACVASETSPTNELADEWMLPSGARRTFETINSADQGYYFDRLAGRVGSARMLKPDFRLLLRHASGALFQEAHAQVVLPEEGWLPGLGPLDAVLNTSSLSIASGAFFTPPSIARTIAEEALREFDSQDGSIVVFDPACGSGELLKEVVRILEIRRFSGTVLLRGWDQSQAAVDIAKFSLGWEASSWGGRLRLEIDVVDSVLAPAWPTDVNVLVMNPPFKSWQQMSAAEQGAVQLSLHDLQSNKPNLASVFIRRASQTLTPGGVLATVAPRSFFDASSSKKLREAVLETVSPRLIVNLANPSLYMYATVQSGIFVAKRAATAKLTTLVWTDPRPSSVGEALRGLRRFQLEAGAAVNEPSYSIYRDAETTRDANSWLPRPYAGWALGRLLKERRGLTSAGSVFAIHQGVRMGSDVFLVPASFADTLDEFEKAYFRPAVTNSTLIGSKLNEDVYVFYPYTVGLEKINSEEDLSRLVPIYYRDYLQPKRAELMARKSLDKARQPWWGLIWPRDWQFQISPKLVSKYFGHAGSFAWDRTGEFVAVVGHGWIPRGVKKHWELVSEEEYSLATIAVLSSGVGEQLLSLVSVQVGGGQWDLSSKYVAEIPLITPNRANAPAVRELAELGRKITAGENVDSLVLDDFVSGVYGVPFNALRN